VSGHVVALCGGVGGAKLAFGLAAVLSPERLSIVVNTGDDFEHLGLAISPDVDTVAYTLAGLSDRERGWGLAGESWAFMDSLRRLGGEDWFNLGDRDLAMHVERTRRLRAGERLSEVTATLAGALGLRHAILPMSDDPVRTVIETDTGQLAFQHYFVRDRCVPVARAIRYDGVERATASAPLTALFARDDVAAVIVCPSNPYLSIDPILAVPGVREGIAAWGAPIVAVSPIVGGEAIKGPAAKLMRELDQTPGQRAIADHYRGLLSGLVVDETDLEEAAVLELPTLVTATVMRSDADRAALAAATLDFAARLR
jgi:LPPG:FO 2-phospho-L-lactate transferase